MLYVVCCICIGAYTIAYLQPPAKRCHKYNMPQKCYSGAAKGRTNIELREQFILADGVSQSMAAFTPRRSTPNAAATASSSPNAQNGGSSNLPPYMSGQGPIIKVNQTANLKGNQK